MVKYNIALTIDTKKKDRHAILLKFLKSKTEFYQASNNQFTGNTGDRGT